MKKLPERQAAYLAVARKSFEIVKAVAAGRSHAMFDDDLGLRFYMDETMDAAFQVVRMYDWTRWLLDAEIEKLGEAFDTVEDMVEPQIEAMDMLWAMLETRAIRKHFVQFVAAKPVWQRRLIRMGDVCFQEELERAMRLTTPASAAIA